MPIQPNENVLESSLCSRGTEDKALANPITRREHNKMVQAEIYTNYPNNYTCTIQEKRERWNASTLLRLCAAHLPAAYIHNAAEYAIIKSRICFESHAAWSNCQQLKVSCVHPGIKSGLIKRIKSNGNKRHSVLVWGYTFVKSRLKEPSSFGFTSHKFILPALL